MKKYILSGVVLLSLLGGCTKEEAPVEKREEPVAENTIKAKLVWFDTIGLTTLVRLQEDTEGKYQTIGSENITVTIENEVNNDIISYNKLLYDAEYTVKFEEGKITSMTVLESDKDVWKEYLTNGYYNVITLQGKEHNNELTDILNDLSHTIPNMNPLYDNNTTKSVRDYTEYGVELGETCIVIFNGYNYLGTIRNNDDYTAIKEKI